MATAESFATSDRIYSADVATFDLLTREEEVEIGTAIQAAFERMRLAVCRLPVIARVTRKQPDVDPALAKRLRTALRRLERDDAWRNDPRIRDKSLREIQRLLSKLETNRATWSGWMQRVRSLHRNAKELNGPGTKGLQADFERENLLPIRELQLILDEVSQAERDWERQKARMVNANLRLVLGIARSYRSPVLTRQDLIQEGNLGLIRAAEKFDPTLGYRFATYAVRWIRLFMSRAIDNQASAVRVPLHMVARRKRIRRVSARIRTVEGREPTDQEIADGASLTMAEIEDVGSVAVATDVSLEAPISEDGTPRGALIPDEDGTPPEDVVAAHETQYAIKMALSKLPPREAWILQLRFGLGSNREHTLQEIADKIGVTRERVRQVEANALRRLRNGGGDALRAYVAALD